MKKLFLSVSLLLASALYAPSFDLTCIVDDMTIKRHIESDSLKHFITEGDVHLELEIELREADIILKTNIKKGEEVRMRPYLVMSDAHNRCSVEVATISGKDNSKVITDKLEITHFKR